MPRRKNTAVAAGASAPASPAIPLVSVTTQEVTPGAGKAVEREIVALGFVSPYHPSESMNPENLEVTRAVFEIRERKSREAMGYSVTPTLIGASPSSVGRAKLVLT